jgi:hypothetical protein
MKEICCDPVGNGRPNVLRVGLSRFGADHDAAAFARDLSRCWAMCVQILRAMHWCAQLWGLKAVVVVVLGGGVKCLVGFSVWWPWGGVLSVWSGVGHRGQSCVGG